MGRHSSTEADNKDSENSNEPAKVDERMTLGYVSRWLWSFVWRSGDGLFRLQSTVVLEQHIYVREDSVVVKLK